MDYESPISMMTEEIITSLRSKEDQLVLEACQKVGVNVSKDELLRALEYDRAQYKRGYAVGYNDGLLAGLRKALLLTVRGVCIKKGDLDT